MEISVAFKANQFAKIDLLAVQEHRLPGDKIKEAQREALALGWRSAFSESILTDKGADLLVLLGFGAQIFMSLKLEASLMTPGSYQSTSRRLA